MLKPTTKVLMIVKTTEDLNVLVDRVEAAQKKFAEFSREIGRASCRERV